ncbi:MAG: methylated-DNA--[protein]-cysteine S-methyltransferase [Desulfohalobiaceae bacterium]
MTGSLSQETVIQYPLALQAYWQGQRLLKLELCFASQCPSGPKRSCPGSRLGQCLQDYLQGRQAAVADLTLAWELLSDFQILVLSRLQAGVGKGQWISYQGLAELCGRPRAARAVGRVMAKNPWPLLVPCHRVLAGGGKLGGFSSGLQMKRFLLNLEGIAYQE